jgi:hypothetical protein
VGVPRSGVEAVSSGRGSKTVLKKSLQLSRYEEWLQGRKAVACTPISRQS